QRDGDLLGRLRLLYRVRLMKILGWWLGLCAALLLAGCVGAPVVSAPDDFISDTRLTSVHVVWVKNDALKIAISKNGYMAAPSISDQEKDDAQKSIFVLSKLLEKVAVPRLKKALAEHGVSDGTEATLVIEPVAARYLVNGERAIRVRVSIRRPHESVPAWSEELNVFGLLSQNGSDVLNNFVDKVISEMKRVRWIG
ncbi:MAG: hypothetical protein P4L70_07625, partial [Parasulfuritortus sp.]|nr:hypothetical protein [Parasulfuritortus sp.]